MEYRATIRPTATSISDMIIVEFFAHDTWHDLRCYVNGVCAGKDMTALVADINSWYATGKLVANV